jgi:hypothetical protein
MKKTFDNTKKLSSNIFDSVQEKLFAQESSHQGTESEPESDNKSDEEPVAPLIKRNIIKAKRTVP